MQVNQSPVRIEDTELTLTDQRGFVRAEIDTSAPFESVKEAASRFGGGIGFWKPCRRENEHELEDTVEIEKQKAMLTANLVEKESETLRVMKELEHANKLAGELKSKIKKELSEQDADMKANAFESNGLSAPLEMVDHGITDEKYSGVVEWAYASSDTDVILVELNEEKLKNVLVTKASIEFLKQSIENERNEIEMTRKRLATNSFKISSLDKEINQTRRKVESVKDSGADEVSGNPTELSTEIQRLKSETEELKLMGEAAKSGLFSAMLEIEQTKSRIKIAEMSLATACTMKEAAKKSEEAARSELKCLTNDECPANDDYAKSKGVSLSREEYEALVVRARDAEQLSNERVQTAMVEVDEANVSKMEMLMKVERATEEVKMTKILMENALRRVETATMEKLTVEESLRQRRSGQSKKRHGHSSSTKFKTVGPSQYRKEHTLHDINGVSLVSENHVPVLRPTLSIGQILNNKLQQLDQPEPLMNSVKKALHRNESLGQMLNRREQDTKPDNANDPKPAPRKSTKFTFTRLSLSANQSKKKKTTGGPRFMMCKGEP